MAADDKVGKQFEHEGVLSCYTTGTMALKAGAVRVG